jgi:L-rhamnonate dehydratase
MKIRSIKAIYPNFNHVENSWRTHLWQIIVRIETDTGVIGWGYGGGGKSSLEIINGHFSEVLEGRELNYLNDISDIWDFLYKVSIPYGRKGIAIMAISGVDLALYDVLGKVESKPVAELIGKVNKEKIRCYATGVDTEWYSEMGFTAQKLPHRWTGAKSIDQAYKSANSSRSILGNQAEIMFDVYMSWDIEITLRMVEALEDFNIFWFEDILTPDQLEEIRELREKIKPINMAGGEHEFTEYGFREIALTKAYDIWQPDITWCGGITAGMRIMDIAKKYDVSVVPHRGGEPWGLHLIAASDCENFAELVMGQRSSIKDDIWIGSPTPIDGKIELSDKSGFGVEPNY